jgi:hypothetical protein
MDALCSKVGATGKRERERERERMGEKQHARGMEDFTDFKNTIQFCL